MDLNEQAKSSPVSNIVNQGAIIDRNTKLNKLECYHSYNRELNKLECFDATMFLLVLINMLANLDYDHPTTSVMIQATKRTY